MARQARSKLLDSKYSMKTLIDEINVDEATDLDIKIQIRKLRN